MEIRKQFTNIHGICYPLVREVAFDNGEYVNLGKPVTASHGENNTDKLISDDKIFDTMYIYQNVDNPTIGYRIYSDYADWHFNGHSDDKLIQNLQERQEGVKLTSFPTGVVTKNGYIIGQEIPFFPNHSTLDIFLKTCSIGEAISLYKQLLVIFKELYINGITYTDIHAGNFMVNNNFKIELIDFDEKYVLFDKKEKLQPMIVHLYTMINSLSSFTYKIPSLLDTQKISFDFDNIMEELDKKEKVLVKK